MNVEILIVCRRVAGTEKFCSRQVRNVLENELLVLIALMILIPGAGRTEALLCFTMTSQVLLVARTAMLRLNTLVSVLTMCR